MIRWIHKKSSRWTNLHAFLRTQRLNILSKVVAFPIFTGIPLHHPILGAIEKPSYVRKAVTQTSPSKKLVYLFAGTLLLFLLAWSLRQVFYTAPPEKTALELDSFPAKQATVKYGFALDTFYVERDTINRNEFLGDLLFQRGISYVDIDRLARNAKDIFDVRKIREGRPYLLLSTDTTQAPDYFIYEPSAYQYVVYSLKDSMEVFMEKRPVEKVIKTYYGAISSNLWEAIVGQGLNWDVAVKMEDALQWQVDFHQLQPGDQFRMVYEEDVIDGRSVGIGRLWAAGFKNAAHAYQAIYFDHPKLGGYYDSLGRTMEAPFLKAPVKYTRISSRYNPRRFHPILKRVRPHYGTDYAAPRGTPIYAVGNGTVIEASRTRGNGNYVKIRHDKTYTTQYLHMQGFARGIRPGVQVRQGQVIGYVGSTGLATGPHVCFRFWKNGRQINHMTLNFPPKDPLPEEMLPEFFEIRDRYLGLLRQAQPAQDPPKDTLLIGTSIQEDEIGLNP